MSFGISGSPTSNRMVGGDVVVAGVDQTTISGFAQDYYLLDKSQCIVQQDTGQVSGSCPDTNIQVILNTFFLIKTRHPRGVRRFSKIRNTSNDNH